MKKYMDTLNNKTHIYIQDYMLQVKTIIEQTLKISLRNKMHIILMIIAITLNSHNRILRENILSCIL